MADETLVDLLDRSRPSSALSRRSLCAVAAVVLALCPVGQASARLPSARLAPARLAPARLDSAGRGGNWAVSKGAATKPSPPIRRSTADRSHQPLPQSQPRSSVSAAENWAAVVGAAAGSAGGYWVALAGGAVVSAGTAPPLEATTPGTTQTGSAQDGSDQTTAIAADPVAPGYWLLSRNGRIRTFGAARSFGSRSLHGAVAIASAPDGDGYWVATDLGHVFAFGRAPWAGSAADRTLDSPVVEIIPTTNGRGYWLVTRRGQVLAFGGATAPAQEPTAPPGTSVIGMAPAPGGHGYWLATSDGQVLTAGGAPLRPSASGELGGAEVVSFAASGQGYWMVTSAGNALSFDAPRLPPASLPTVPRTPLPVTSAPARSISPPAAFSVACFETGSLPACDRAALAAIDTARASEGYGPLLLPPGFYGLDPSAQLVAVANAERTSRGLPALPRSAPLDTLALQGANAGHDPIGPEGTSWASNISWGYPSALAADFAWMYDDGPGSPNLDCPRAGAPGCWGHRRDILAPWSGASGAAAVKTSNGWVLTELFVAGAR